MKKTLLIIAVLLTAISNFYAVERMVVRIESPEHNLVSGLMNQGYDIASYRPGEYLDIVVTDAEKEQLLNTGLQLEITQTEERLKNNLQAQALTIDGYRTYDDIVFELQQIAEDYPEITRLYDLADSWGKIYTDDGNDYYEDFYFDIWGLKLTAEPDSLRDRPAVYYVGAHHAREPLSAEVPMDFLRLLLDGYGEDQQITYLVDNTEIWFLPLVNPDGHKVVLDRTDVWWRKNIRDNNRNGRFDTDNHRGRGDDGVDPNRNYGHEWQFNPDMNSVVYTGPAPGSEPEIAAFKKLLAEKNFLAGISYHTYSELVLFPYGYASNVIAPDNDALKDLAVTMAEATPTLDRQDHYVPMQAYELYPARGTTDDYAYGQHGVFAYTFELATEFIPPPEEVKQISEDNMEAAMILLERVHKSLVTGTVTDSHTGEPLRAEIFIQGIDDQGSFRQPYMSEKQFGRYNRLLLPGNYRMNVSAEGYHDSGTIAVVINEDEKTEIDVKLDKKQFGGITGKITAAQTMKPLANVRVEVKSSPSRYDITDEYGVFTVDGILYGKETLRVTKQNYGSIEHELNIDRPLQELEFAMYPPYMTENFETLDLWDTDGFWHLSSVFSYLGSKSLAAVPQADSALEKGGSALYLKPLDLTDIYNASVTFMSQYYIVGENEQVSFQVRRVSDDPEDGWEKMALFSGSSTWRGNDILLTDYLEDKIYIRFVYHTAEEEETSSLGFYLDDFKLYKSGDVFTQAEDYTLPSPQYLSQNIPNPFNAETTISFYLEKDKHINLEVFNIKGRKVACLAAEEYPAGNHSIVWNGINDSGQPVGSGLYFYRLSFAGYSETRKMILLK